MKLIALKILSGTPDYMRKVLEENEFYYFVSGYEIQDNSIIEYADQLLPTDFYSQKLKKKDIEVSVSAIVGKNGSGKSTLIELLFRIINNVAWKYNLSKNIRPDQLQLIENINAELYFKTDTFYKLIVRGTNISIFKSNRNKLTTGVKLDEYFIRSFFYSITVNYSHYSYNVNDYGTEGKWINGLFHKNDGYQIPLVITPMRIDGDIDINNENHLVKSRLMLMFASGLDLNIIKDELNPLYLVLKIRESKRIGFKGVFIKKEHESKLLEELGVSYKVKKIGYSVPESNQNLLVDYIICKIQAICNKYDDYKIYKERYLMGELNFLRNLTIKLYEDNSHITLKLRQAIYLFKYKHIDLKNQMLTFSKLEETIDNIISKKNSKLIIDKIDLLPPPIFESVIYVKEGDVEYPFSMLSSGEKQMAYSFSSLLYHLHNLDSVSNSSKRVAYKHVNFILEEIELYFHPEMQRNYIQKLLQSIEKVNFKRIKSINFCFITHSPFILSDIPNPNVLFLDKGQSCGLSPLIKNTFGANIHMLFKSNFFLSGALMGEFAKEKIKNIFQIIDSEDQDAEELLRIITLIGEPLIRDQLLKKYNEKHPQSIIEKLKKLEIEIASLKYNV